MGYAWRQNELASFGHIVRLYGTSLERRFDRQVRKTRIETIFNQAEPFYACMMIYLAAFLFAALSWLKWPRRRGARPWGSSPWDGRSRPQASRPACGSRAGPPVTNLYSSALFIGWARWAFASSSRRPTATRSGAPRRA